METCCATINNTNQICRIPCACGTKEGLSTLARTCQRVTPKEWREDYKCKAANAYSKQDSSDYKIKESKELITSTQALTDHNQKLSTQRLKERLIDIEFWKTELHKQIDLLTEEINLLAAQQKRLENALMTLETPLVISADNYNIRARRICHDDVKDLVEQALCEEIDAINKAQALIKRTILQVMEQQKKNKCRKEALEMDWSDKIEAISFDAPAGRLHNGSTNKQFYNGVARLAACMLDPLKWAENSRSNINEAMSCREESKKLRVFINEMLVNVAIDLRTKADNVESKLEENLRELYAARQLLMNSLRDTVSAIKKQEDNIKKLRYAIRDKDDPTRVAQTRLHLRSLRPCGELTCDSAQAQLISEVSDLTQTLEALMCQMCTAEQELKMLTDSQMNLERELAIKNDTINLNRSRVVKHREWYPATIKLQGY